MASINCPKNSMYDEKLVITIEGLQPHKMFTVHGLAVIENGSTFESLAVYNSDSTGCIDMSTSESLHGTYTGVEPMGLFWSMQQSLCNKYENKRFVKLDVTTPLVVKISLYGIVIESLKEMSDLQDSYGNLDKFRLTSINANRWLLARGTKRVPLNVKRHGLNGTLFVPNGVGPFPGVIVTFGGYPGTLEFKAALLSSHGFVTLALAFFGAEGLPGDIFVDQSTEKLRLEYFEHAADFLSNHKSVDSQCGIGMISLSFSTSVALALVEYCKKITCVIWINGIFQPTACSIYYKDKIIKPIVQEVNNLRGQEKLRSFFEAVKPQKIVENKWISGDYTFNFQHQHNVAYMFIASLNDESVPAEQYANWAERLLNDAKHPNFIVLRYPGAGHLLEPPYGIHNRKTSITGLYTLDWGGIAVPHCKAQEASWKPQIDFLRKSLANKVPKL